MSEAIDGSDYVARCRGFANGARTAYGITTRSRSRFVGDIRRAPPVE